MDPGVTPLHCHAHCPTPAPWVQGPVYSGFGEVGAWVEPQPSCEQWRELPCARGNDPRALFALDAVLKEPGIRLTICQMFKNWEVMPVESISHSGPAPDNCGGNPQTAAHSSPPSIPCSSCFPERGLRALMWTVQPCTPHPCPQASPFPAVVTPRPAVDLKKAGLGGRVGRSSQ